MTGWRLAIDFGTTATAAALAIGDSPPEVLLLDGLRSMPSGVYLGDGGRLVVGRAAFDQAALAPERYEATPKRRLGEPVLLLGEEAVDPTDAAAAVLAAVHAEACRRRDGELPAAVAVTHPVAWGAARRRALVDAASKAGISEPVLVPEPVAAALQATWNRTEGARAVVYDLGGGTFDVAVLRCAGDAVLIAGPPAGDERMGGEVLDDRVVEHLLGRLPASTASSIRVDPDRVWRRAALDLRRGARAAREALSSSSSYAMYLGAPIDVELSIDRAELEGLIREPIEATVRTLVQAIERGGHRVEELDAVVVVGGVARTPLVTTTLERSVGMPVTTWGDPKAAVALGALHQLEVEPPSVATTPPLLAPATDPPSVVAPVAVEPRLEDLLPPPPPAPTPPSPPAPAVPTRDEGPPDRPRMATGTVIAIALVAVGLLCALLLLLGVGR